MGLLLFAIGCGEAEPTCDVAELADRLSSAEAGDTVRIGACVVELEATLPSGVALVGEGRTASTIVVPAGGIGIDVLPGGGQTRISDLAVQSIGRGAIVADGSTDLAIDRVDVRVGFGIGIGVDSLRSLSMADVQITGTITPANAPSIPRTAGPMDAPTYGLVVLFVPTAQLTDVTVSGFAEAGVTFVSSAVVWTGGGSTDSRAVGLQIESGSATLDGVDLSRIFDGLAPRFAFGLYSDNATVVTSDLVVEDGEGFGVLHDGGVVEHMRVVARRNDNAAMWIQSGSLEATGIFEDNDFASIVAVDATAIDVHDTVINRTVQVSRALHERATIQVGDGLHLVRSHSNARISDSTLTSNERVGILIDLDGATLPTGIFSNVDVTAMGPTSYTVVAQAGTAAPRWDDGLTLTSTSTTVLLVNPLDVVGATGPCDRPRPTGTSTAGLTNLGI